MVECFPSRADRVTLRKEGPTRAERSPAEEGRGTQRDDGTECDRRVNGWLIQIPKHLCVRYRQRGVAA